MSITCYLIPSFFRDWVSRDFSWDSQTSAWPLQPPLTFILLLKTTTRVPAWSSPPSHLQVARSSQLQLCIPSSGTHSPTTLPTHTLHALALLSPPLEGHLRLASFTSLPWALFEALLSLSKARGWEAGNLALTPAKHSEGRNPTTGRRPRFPQQVCGGARRPPTRVRDSGGAHLAPTATLPQAARYLSMVQSHHACSAPPAREVGGGTLTRLRSCSAPASGRRRRDGAEGQCS